CLDAALPNHIEQDGWAGESLFSRYHEVVDGPLHQPVVIGLVEADVQAQKFPHILKLQRRGWVAEITQNFVHSPVNLCPDGRLEDKVFHAGLDCSTIAFKTASKTCSSSGVRDSLNSEQAA